MADPLNLPPEKGGDLPIGEPERVWKMASTQAALGTITDTSFSLPFSLVSFPGPRELLLCFLFRYSWHCL